MVAESDDVNSFKNRTSSFSRYCIINIFECHIFFNINQIVMVFSVVNGKTFPEHAGEMIF